MEKICQLGDMTECEIFAEKLEYEYKMKLNGAYELCGMLLLNIDFLFLQAIIA